MEPSSHDFRFAVRLGVVSGNAVDSKRQVDASDDGLGVVLRQPYHDGHLQTIACSCFHKFDQPLEIILRKALNKAPARLQKMMMKLQRYTFDVTLCVANTMSRAALSTPTEAKVTGFEVS